VRTGPYTAVRELIPFLVDERRKSKRFEVGIGKPNREGLGTCEIPGTKSAASGVTRQPRTDPEFQQSCSTTTLGFPLPPQSSPKPQTHPADETNQHFGSFAKAEVTSPAPQIRNQFGHRSFNADALCRACDFPNSLLETLQGFGRNRELAVCALCNPVCFSLISGGSGRRAFVFCHHKVLLAAVQLAACQKGYRVRFATAAGLVHELMEARDEKRLLRIQKQLAGYQLLIIDELGFVPLSRTAAELLFEIFSQRYERGATLVTSNLPFNEWTEILGTERLTGALLDRLTHHIHILEMNGDSYRLKESKQIRKAAARASATASQ
jgi:hypothetical protein